MRVQTVTVSPRLSLTTLPGEIRAHAQQMSRQTALDLTAAGRDQVLEECVDELEAYLGRLVVPVSRTVVTEATFDSTPTEPVSLAPRYPDMSGAGVSGVIVRRWNVDDYETITVERRPGGRVVLTEAGDFEFTVEVDPTGDMPHQFVEACGRLYAYRTTQRPGDKGDMNDTVNLSAAVLRSGAGEVLSGIRRVT